jgi:DnaK suppressor protein
MRRGTLEKVRAILLKRRTALRRALADDVNLLRRTSDAVGDEVDAALETAAGEASSQLAEVESRELLEIENALARIKDGSYGKCEVCEKAIAPARLTALPYATCCINCARKEERFRQAGRWSAKVDRASFAEVDD